MLRQPAWIRNPIDRFILARLESLRLTPAPPASRRTVIRRLYLDLIGLPPGRAEVQEFLDDRAHDAYEQVVDRLLNSPHYGERWARRWLDQARYADSHGYDMDQPRPHAWRYRHWVIEALNRDLPFDQFTIEQLAGDLLPQPTIDQLAATGFHRNALKNTEFGADPEEDAARRAFDRTNTTATVWLGLTLHCCRCHDHRYDPLTQRDYYGLYAFFNHLVEDEIPAPLLSQLAQHEPKLAAFERVYEPIVAFRHHYEQTVIPDRLAAWESQLAPIETARWHVLRPRTAAALRGDELLIQEDGSLLAHGQTPNDTIYTVETATELDRITAIRLEVLPHISLPRGGPGRAPDGDFDLYKFSVRAAPADQPFTPSDPDRGWRRLRLINPVADFAKEGRGIEHALGSYGRKIGWSIGPRTGVRHVAVFELAEPLRAIDAVKLEFSLGTGTTDWFQVIGRFRLSATDTATPFLDPSIPESAGAVLSQPATARSPAEQSLLRQYYGSRDPQWIQLNRTAKECLKLAPPDPRTTMARTIGERAEARPTYVFERGDFLQPSDEVQRQTPSFLPPLRARGSRPDRLDLARWIVDPNNPLTARVTVNRIWQHHFGRGLVSTDGDFGTHGAEPSHPELLDWLATQFIAGDWSLKALHRLIVTSATYRQASRFRAELSEIDPGNSLLARQSRIRVEAEAVRDIALVTSGLLDRRVGGPSVVLPQPSGSDDLAFSRGTRLTASDGADLYRRGLYIWSQRTAIHPLLTTFDGPNANLTCTRRPQSTTPQQALLRLNDPVFFECAQTLAKRMISDVPRGVDGADLCEVRAKYLFQECLSRMPTSDELAEVVHWHGVYQSLYAERPEFAIELTAQRGVVSSYDAELRELAAWVMIARIVMNLEEFIVRE